MWPLSSICAGRRLMIPTACAAGNYAIGYGYDLIRTGRADLMLAGGADAFSRIPYTGFRAAGRDRAGALPAFRQEPQRHGAGRGSGMLVLEPLDAALARGAKIYAEVLGYGVSCDAHHMTAAHPQGDGAIRAMSAAMKDSGVGIGRHRLHQRPRHRHADQRPHRIAGRADAVRRARDEGSDEFHQVDARPHHGRGERDRSRRLCAGAGYRLDSADHQLRRAGPGLRSGLSCRIRPG